MGCGAVQTSQASQPIRKSDSYKESTLENKSPSSQQKNIQKKSQSRQAMNNALRIKQMLGKGTYGEVYRCERTQTGEQFALKIVKLNAKNKEEAIRHINNLKSQISLLKKLNHPNIVKYHSFDVSPDNQTVQIVFELIQDGSLKDYLQKNGPLSQINASKICKQILQGLDYLHQKSIIHRDLKCANILMAKNGVVKITDFGTAKQVKVKNHQDIAKLCASLKGTPYYMAPQILKRSGHHKSADIWSFGCTLIQMLTGKAPWTTLTQNFQEIISYIISGIHPPLPPKITKQCDFFLQSCFDVVPSQRLTARQLLNHRFILMSSKVVSPSSVYEKISSKTDKKSIISYAPKKISENNDDMDVNSIKIAGKNKSERQNFFQQDSQLNQKHNGFKKVNKKSIIQSNNYSKAFKQTQLSEPFLNYYNLANKQIEVSQSYIPLKKSNLKSQKKGRKDQLKKVAKTAGNLKMTEENLANWNQIEEQDISNQRTQKQEISSRPDSSLENTYFLNQNTKNNTLNNVQLRAYTENTQSYDQVINTSLAQQQRQWYLQNQRFLNQRKEEQRKKWEEQLKKQKQASMASKKQISQRLLKNLH